MILFRISRIAADLKLGIAHPAALHLSPMVESMTHEEWYPEYCQISDHRLDQALNKRNNRFIQIHIQ